MMDTKLKQSKTFHPYIDGQLGVSNTIVVHSQRGLLEGKLRLGMQYYPMHIIVMTRQFIAPVVSHHLRHV